MKNKYILYGIILFLIGEYSFFLSLKIDVEITYLYVLIVVCLYLIGVILIGSGVLLIMYHLLIGDERKK